LRRKGLYSRLWLLQQRMERQDKTQSTSSQG
jgi:hypothetical protein